DGSPTGPEGPSGVPAEVSNALRRSVLDAVLDDAERLKMTVGTEDALRIDAHMESIRAIEQRIPVAEGDATSTGTTGGSTPMETCTPEAPPMSLEDMTATSRALNRLITAAVACNLTRVYTHLWSGARDENTYPTIPVNSAHHDLTHGGQTAQYSQIE